MFILGGGSLWNKFIYLFIFFFFCDGVSPKENDGKLHHCMVVHGAKFSVIFGRVAQSASGL
jgi:hypothetical protein